MKGIRSVGAGLWLPLPQDYKDVLDVDGEQYLVNLCIDYSIEKQKVVVLSMRIDSPSDSGVTGKVMRMARFGDLLSNCFQNIVFRIEMGDGSLIHNPLPILVQARNSIADNPNDIGNKYLWIARVYRAAEVVGGAPNQEVHDLLGISTRSASEWIKKAKAWFLQTGQDWDGSKQSSIDYSLQPMSSEEYDAFRKQNFVGINNAVD